jgi:uncharacterized phage-associated protein
VGTPYEARAIANGILELIEAKGGSVTNLKLQKLLFLCHAFYLVEIGDPLIEGEFEAWQYGPVHRGAYEAFKVFGDKEISAKAERLDPVRRTLTRIAAPTDPAVVRVLDKVVNFYGKWRARQLVDLTHAKDGPWDFAVKASGSRGNVGLKISNDVIKERFKHHWKPIDFGSVKDDPYEDHPIT